MIVKPYATTAKMSNGCQLYNDLILVDYIFIEWFTTLVSRYHAGST